MVTGKTKNLGVIGNPIAHSLSPAMQNAAIIKAGLDYEYIALPVKEKNLAEAVRGLAALEFRGFNVTIPYKTAVMPFLDRIDKDAAIIGAVNTVVNDDGKLTGYNTDVIGFIDGLLVNGFKAAGKNAVMLGAGGAARAIILGLVKEKIAKIAIGARNTEKVKSLAECFAEYVDISVYGWNSEEFTSALNGADLIVNATPLGMTPNLDNMPPVNWEAVKKSAFVYDIIYTPRETKFLREAAGYGHKFTNGEMMLVGQGAAALKLWTGISPDKAVMLKALHEAVADVIADLSRC